METLFLTLSLIRNLLFNSPVNSQEISLEPYCKNGYYEIPNEPLCSRAPNCGGYGYDELNTSDKMPNAQQCMGDGASGRAQKGCAGYVPLCCYEVARTGDFTKCIGYWERLWCTKSQCDTAKSRGASDSQCGGSCQCGHANETYCGNIDPVPLANRLQGGGSNPTPTSILPTPTSAPNPTSPPANCPTSSSRSFDSIGVTNVGDNRPAKDHADKNIQLRGYESNNNGVRNLVDVNGPTDTLAPQLSTVLRNRTPAIVSLYSVYDWNWGNGSNGSRGGLLSNPYDVTMIGLSANPGDEVRVPDSGYSIGSGFEAIVLYANSDTITLEYTREDSIRTGYAVQYDGICVDPNLVNLYNDLNGQGRRNLPALRSTQTLGTAKNNEVKVAIRDTGSYMDPRAKKDWWIGISSLPNAPGITSQPTATPGGPTSPPGSSPTATPRPGTCSGAVSPVITTRYGAGAFPGRNKFEWTAAPGTKQYAVRIDDMTNGWKGDCSVSQYPGDVCIDNVSASATSFEFTGVETHTYSFWIHSINYCGEWSKSAYGLITVPPVGNASTCRIQGYRAQTRPDGTNEIFPIDSIKSAPVTATGGSVIGSYQFNPYYFLVSGNQSYTVSIAPVSGYTIASTYCVNGINCHTDLPTNQTLQNGATRTVTCPAGGFADLWWHFIPAGTPTLSIPRPTATPGGSPTPTSPPPTPTVDYPTPTPSPCPAISPLEWREGDRYTRTIISYDGVNVIENIALHLKQITQSGLVVQVSTDGGSTWAPSDSSQNDDHFVTIKNRQTEVINLKVRLLNSCSVTSPELSATIQTVPLPSISPLPTQRPSITTSPMISREVLIGGTLIIGLIIAAFFVGA